jgi:Flp pilus assembly protein TadD
MAVAACCFCLSLAGCQSVPVRKDDVQAEAQPNDEEQWAQTMNAGNMAFRAGDPQRAIYHYMMASKIKPTNAAPFVRIGQVHEHSGRADAAEQAYRLALAREASSLHAQEGLGLALLRQGKHAEAREQLSAIAAKDATRWRVQNALGVLADMDGNFPAARVHYQAAMQTGGTNPQVLNNYGYSYYLSNDWESAARIFTEVVEKNASYWPAWSNLGLVRVRQIRYQEAQMIFRKFMTEHEALNTMGYLCTLTGDYKNAENYLNQAVSASPTFYKDAYENLAYLRYKM